MRKLTTLLFTLALAACASDNLTLVPEAATSITAQVSAGADDAEEYLNGTMYLDSSDLELGDEPYTGQQFVGMRFPNIQVPKGATITSARLEVRAASNDKGRVTYYLYAQASDDAAAFTETSRNISARPLSRARQAWSPAGWVRGNRYGVSGLQNELQEVINRPGWKPGNALGLVIKPRTMPRRNAVSFEGRAGDAPRLFITYEGGEAVPAEPEPEPAPTPERELIFADEFGGTALDTSKWSSGYPWTNPDGNYNRSTGEQQVYLPRNIVVSDGTVKLIAKRESVNGRPYTSGMISSDPRNGTGFLHTYGYIEARIKVPGGKGMWPAFWNLPWPVKWPPEIDIVEVLGDECMAEFHLHPEANYQGTNVCDTWHTYAVDWRPGKVVWYLDGVERYREEGDHAPNQPMYLLLNLAVGGTWPGSPDISTPFPGVMEIDYVRVYR